MLRGDGDRKQHILFKPPNYYWGPSCGTESDPPLLPPRFSQPFHFITQLLPFILPPCPTPSILHPFLFPMKFEYHLHNSRPHWSLLPLPPPPPPPPLHTGVIAGTLPFTDAQNQHSEERSRLLLMTSVDKRDARVRLDAAMQAVINKSASDVIKVRSRCVQNVLLHMSYFTSHSLTLLHPYISLPPLLTSFPLAFHSFLVSSPTLIIPLPHFTWHSHFTSLLIHFCSLTLPFPSQQTLSTPLPGVHSHRSLHALPEEQFLHDGVNRC